MYQCFLSLSSLLSVAFSARAQSWSPDTVRAVPYPVLFPAERKKFRLHGWLKKFAAPSPAIDAHPFIHSLTHPFISPIQTARPLKKQPQWLVKPEVALRVSHPFHRIITIIKVSSYGNLDEVRFLRWGGQPASTQTTQRGRYGFRLPGPKPPCQRGTSRAERSVG